MVKGVAELYGNIFIAFGGSNTIFVFSTERSYRRRRDIVIKGMKYPEDLAANSAAGHLYIADWGGQCIWRVELDDSVERDFDVDDKEIAFTAVKWATDVRIGRISSMFVTTSGSVLITDSRLGELTVLNERGQKEEVMSLKEKGIDVPKHAVVSSIDDTIIVCHTDWQKRCHRVCKLDRSGQVVVEFVVSVPQDEDKFQDPGPMSRPEHLAPGADDKVLFVVDDSGIVVLDDRLRLCRVLLRPLEKSCRWTPRICYVRESRRLLVVWGGGYVQVYGV